KETVAAIPTPPVKPIIGIKDKKRSGLSLSSLTVKKEHEKNKKSIIVDPNQLPKQSFTEEEMQGHWNDYVTTLDKKGKKILASSLSTDIPKLLEDHTLWIQLPNSTMKKEVERDQSGLIQYLREKLNNHFISLKISVNEQQAQKYAFTPEEKYQKLREKNPALDLLRKEFDLDL
ncbi:MAG: DNA polymerase III subunit gamma/tau, partial [Flavobacteriaceae bacterium]